MMSGLLHLMASLCVGHSAMRRSMQKVIRKVFSLFIRVFFFECPGREILYLPQALIRMLSSELNIGYFHTCFHISFHCIVITREYGKRNFYLMEIAVIKNSNSRYQQLQFLISTIRIVDVKNVHILLLSITRIVDINNSNS